MPSLSFFSRKKISFSLSQVLLSELGIAAVEASEWAVDAVGDVDDATEEDNERRRYFSTMLLHGLWQHLEESFVYTCKLVGLSNHS